MNSIDAYVQRILELNALTTVGVVKDYNPPFNPDFNPEMQTSQLHPLKFAWGPAPGKPSISITFQPASEEACKELVVTYEGFRKSIEHYTALQEFLSHAKNAKSAVEIAYRTVRPLGNKVLDMIRPHTEDAVEQIRNTFVKPHGLNQILEMVSERVVDRYLQERAKAQGA